MTNGRAKDKIYFQFSMKIAELKEMLNYAICDAIHGALCTVHRHTHTKLDSVCGAKRRNFKWLNENASQLLWRKWGQIKGQKGIKPKTVVLLFPCGLYEIYVESLGQLKNWFKEKVNSEYDKIRCKKGMERWIQ